MCFRLKSSVNDAEQILYEAYEYEKDHMAVWFPDEQIFYTVEVFLDVLLTDEILGDSCTQPLLLDNLHAETTLVLLESSSQSSHDQVSLRHAHEARACVSLRLERLWTEEVFSVQNE